MRIKTHLRTLRTLQYLLGQVSTFHVVDVLHEHFITNRTEHIYIFHLIYSPQPFFQVSIHKEKKKSFFFQKIAC